MIAIAIILGGESSDSVAITFIKVANPTLTYIDFSSFKPLAPNLYCTKRHTSSLFSLQTLQSRDSYVVFFMI